MNCDMPWHSSEKLDELYNEQRLTLERIAERVDKSVFKVHQELSKSGISRRGPGVITIHPTIRTNEAGYVEVSGTHHTIHLHRLIMVAEHGFDAVAGKDVHHINGHPFDNRISNLSLMERGEHTYFHHHQPDLDDYQTTLDDF